MAKALTWPIAIGLAALALFSFLQAYRANKARKAADKRADAIMDSQIGSKMIEADAARYEAAGQGAIAIARTREAEARIAKIKELGHAKIGTIIDTWNNGLRDNGDTDPPPV